MGLTPEQMVKLSFKNSPFLKLADGEISPDLNFLECGEVPSRQPGKNTYRYTLEFMDSEGSCKKFFESTSNALLEKMSKVLGKRIRLQRTGVGVQTKYDVIVVD